MRDAFGVQRPDLVSKMNGPEWLAARQTARHLGHVAGKAKAIARTNQAASGDSWQAARSLNPIKRVKATRRAVRQGEAADDAMSSFQMHRNLGMKVGDVRRGLQ